MSLPAAPSKIHAIIDPNVIDPVGSTEIGSWVASPESTKIAASLPGTGACRLLMERG